MYVYVCVCAFRCVRVCAYFVILSMQVRHICVNVYPSVNGREKKWERISFIFRPKFKDVSTCQLCVFTSWMLKFKRHPQIYIYARARVCVCVCVCVFRKLNQNCIIYVASIFNLQKVGLYHFATMPASIRISGEDVFLVPDMLQKEMKKKKR